MNTSAQPAEGAGGSRSKAAGELTLGLMSGEKRRGVGCSAFALLWEGRCGDPTCSRRRPDSRPDICRCPQSLWELACQRWRTTGRQKPCCCTQFLWERACSRRRPDSRLEFCVCITSKRSQPRCTRQLLQGNAHASEPGRPVGRLGRCCGVRPLVRPSGGSAQWATRHGCRVSRRRPWMADGGGPTEQDRSEGMPSHGEAPNVRGKSVWLLCAFQSDPL